MWTLERASAIVLLNENNIDSKSKAKLRGVPEFRMFYVNQFH